MMDLRERKSRSLTALEWLVISIGVHLYLTAALFLRIPDTQKSEQIEVQFIEKPEENKTQIAQEKDDEKKQIVEQDEKPVNDEIDQNTKFMSAHNQKVVRQTVAPKSDNQFKNTQNKETFTANTKKQLLHSFTPQYNIQKAVEDMHAREAETFKQAKAKTNDVPLPSTQASSTVDYIKDLDPGLETMLSTKEFVYYTYYSRIRKQLYQFWGSKVKEKMVKIYREGRQIASTEDKVTRCLITLDKIGNLVKVQIIGISGIRELDEAAVESFKLAAPFPNPPNGIVDQDGNIKIRWDFVLEM